MIRVRHRVRGMIAPIALILAACAQASPTQPPESATLGTDETLIAEIDLDAIAFDTFTVSPNGRRIAYSAQYSDGQRVFLDNVEEGPYEQLQQSPPIFSPDGNQLAYVADVAGERYVVVNGRRKGPYQDIGVPVFSPVDMTLAFKVRLGPWQAIVLGDETLTNYDQVDDPHFGANGRLAYSARDDDEWFAVIDGEPGARYDDVYLPARPFSADGRRVAYLGVRAEDWYVVVDGEEFGPYAGVADGSLTFSPDGSQVAYLAQVGQWWRVIVDGAAGRLFDSAGAPAFSADGAHWMHPAAWGGRAYLVLDGATLGPYRAVAASPGVAFSPQGERFAYFAQDGDSWFAFADGERGPGFTAVAPLSLTFSPDGGNLAYAGLRGEGWFVVSQGRELGPYEAVVDGSLAFSPDGNHLAFIIQSGETYQVVLDGVLGKPYTTILHVAFSPDGNRLAYAASQGESRFVVLDGEEGPGFEALILGTVGTIVFDGPDDLHYLGVRGSEIYLVETGVAR